MTRRYTVRVRSPMEPHTFALRLNADGGNPTAAHEAHRDAASDHPKRPFDHAGERSTGGYDMITAANI
jgi:hypothetical protein